MHSLITQIAEVAKAYSAANPHPHVTEFEIMTMARPTTRQVNGVWKDAKIVIKIKNGEVSHNLFLRTFHTPPGLGPVAAKDQTKEVWQPQKLKDFQVSSVPYVIRELKLKLKMK